MPSTKDKPVFSSLRPGGTPLTERQKHNATLCAEREPQRRTPHGNVTAEQRERVARKEARHEWLREWASDIKAGSRLDLKFERRDGRVVLPLPRDFTMHELYLLETRIGKICSDDPRRKCGESGMLGEWLVQRYFAAEMAGK